MSTLTQLVEPEENEPEEEINYAIFGATQSGQWEPVTGELTLDQLRELGEMLPWLYDTEHQKGTNIFGIPVIDEVGPELPLLDPEPVPSEDEVAKTEHQKGTNIFGIPVVDEVGPELPLLDLEPVPSPVPVHGLKPTEKASLRRSIVKSFSLDELKEMAFDLGVDYELFSHQKRNKLALELIAYFERRNQLGHLVTEASRLRPDNSDLIHLRAKLPPDSPNQKVQIIIDDDLLDNMSELLGELASELGVTRDQITLVGAAWGSVRLLVSLPQGAANPDILSKIRSLGAGKYQVAEMTTFDSLDLVTQKAWRYVAFEKPPVVALRPSASWKEALSEVKETPSTSEDALSKVLRSKSAEMKTHQVGDPKDQPEAVEAVWMRQVTPDLAVELWPDDVGQIRLVATSYPITVTLDDLGALGRAVLAARNEMKQATKSGRDAVDSVTGQETGDGH